MEMNYIYSFFNLQNIYVKVFKIHAKWKYITYIFAPKGENLYVNKFKMLGKFKKITYISAPKTRIYM